jgi:predicted peptidase
MEPFELRVERAAPLPWVLALPRAAPRPGKPRPVLCFLHGYDEGPPTPLEQGVTRHGPLRDPAAFSSLAPFIVVAPQAPVRGDTWSGYADDVLRLVRQVQDEHGGDRARTYLTGFSFGGNGVFDLALAQPGTWAALWAVDPRRIPRRDPGLPVWLSIGEVSRRASAGFARALALRAFDERATTAGARVFHDQGLDHVGCATSAYRDERIYQWLLDAGRQEDPVDGIG